MSIYDKGVNFDFDFSYEKIKKPLMALGVLVGAVIIILAGLSVYSFLQPKPLEFHFEKNPIPASEQTHLVVTVNNTTSADAVDVTVTARAKLSQGIQVSPVQQNKFPIIESGKWREISFLINPVNEISSGTYAILIETKINELSISEEAVLEIR